MAARGGPCVGGHRFAIRDEAASASARRKNGQVMGEVRSESRGYPLGLLTAARATAILWFGLCTVCHNLHGDESWDGSPQTRDECPKGASPSKSPPSILTLGPSLRPGLRKESSVSGARKRVAVVGVGTMGSQAAWRLALSPRGGSADGVVEASASEYLMYAAESLS